MENCLNCSDAPENIDSSDHILSKVDAARLSLESPKAWYPANQELDGEIKSPSCRGGNGSIGPRKTLFTVKKGPSSCKHTLFHSQ